MPTLPSLSVKASRRLSAEKPIGLPPPSLRAGRSRPTSRSSIRDVSSRKFVSRAKASQRPLGEKDGAYVESPSFCSQRPSARTSTMPRTA